MKRPVVIGGDDQVPARPQDTEDFAQRPRQRNQPLGHANQHDKVKRGIGKRHIVDVTHSRGDARGEARPCGHCRRPIDHFMKAIDGPYVGAAMSDRRRDDAGPASDLQNRTAGGQGETVHAGDRPSGTFLINPTVHGLVAVDLLPVGKRGTKVPLNQRVVRRDVGAWLDVANCAIEAHTARAAC